MYNQPCSVSHKQIKDIQTQSFSNLDVFFIKNCVFNLLEVELQKQAAKIGTLYYICVEVQYQPLLMSKSCKFFFFCMCALSYHPVNPSKKQLRV